MKANILILVIWGLLFFSFPSPAEEVEEYLGQDFIIGDLSTNEGLGLAIELSRKVLKPGSTVRVYLIFENKSSREFSILNPILNKAEGLIIQPEIGGQLRGQDSEYALETPQGVFYAKAHLLRPGGKKVLKWDAFLDREYKLRFASERLREKKPRKPEAHPGIPAKFAASGKVFPLRERGNYSIKFFNRNSIASRRITDAKGEIRLIDNIWVGMQESNEADFVIK